MSYQSKLIDKYINADNAIFYIQIDKSLYKDNVYLINILNKLQNSFVSSLKEIILVKPTDDFIKLQEIINFNEENVSTNHSYIKTQSLMKPFNDNVNNIKYTLNVTSCDQIQKFDFAEQIKSTSD